MKKKFIVGYWNGKRRKNDHDNANWMNLLPIVESRADVLGIELKEEVRKVCGSNWNELWLNLQTFQTNHLILAQLTVLCSIFAFLLIDSQSICPHFLLSLLNMFWISNSCELSRINKLNCAKDASFVGKWCKTMCENECNETHEKGSRKVKIFRSNQHAILEEFEG